MKRSSPRNEAALRLARRPGTSPRQTARCVAFIGGVLGAALCGTSASAQIYTYGQLLDSEIPTTVSTGRNQGVLDRDRPELNQVGVPIGGFLALPSITIGQGYTDNVVIAEIDKRSDVYAEVKPQLTLQSQWQRHSLTGTFYYDARRYLNTGPKNEDGFLAQLDGRLDIQTQSSVFGSASFRRTYENQAEASFPLGGGGAVAVDQPRALIRGTTQTNRLRLTVSGDYNGFRYLDTVSTTGVRLNLSFRDRDVYRTSARAEYLLGKDNSVFTQFTYRRTDYKATGTVNDRTSDEWRGSVGVIADVTDLLRVGGAVGYFHRSYSSPLFRSIGGVVADVHAEYYLSPLTTISAIVSRELDEATIVGSSGYTDLRIGGRIDHELLRNVLPYVFADYIHDDFRGIDRVDRAYDAGGGVTYLVNRRFTAQLSAEYVSRSSRGTQSGPNINELRGLITITFHP
ncbi:MAG: outer membrane beta-barrel protein [Sphingomonas sp.]|jgi:hypothetical protein